MNKLDMWRKYNDTYIDIKQCPRKKQAMCNDPGVKFMEKGWIIVGLIIGTMSVLGYLLY